MEGSKHGGYFWPSSRRHRRWSERCELRGRCDSGVAGGARVRFAERLRRATDLGERLGVGRSLRGAIEDELPEQRRRSSPPAAPTMCRIEKGLRIRMTRLLTPIEVGLLGRLGDGGRQRLALSHGSPLLKVRCTGGIAERIQGVGEGPGRRFRHGRSKVLRGASGAGWSPMFSAPPVEACPNFSCRKRPCTISASASTRTTASKILSIVALNRSS